MTYEIEITRFAPNPVTERYIGATAEAAAQQIQLDNTIEFVVFVAALERESNLDLGNFYVWWNAEMALIELHENCEHYATDPNFPTTQNGDMRF